MKPLCRKEGGSPSIPKVIPKWLEKDRKSDPKTTPKVTSKRPQYTRHQTPNNPDTSLGAGGRGVSLQIRRLPSGRNGRDFELGAVIRINPKIKIKKSPVLEVLERL